MKEKYNKILLDKIISIFTIAYISSFYIFSISNISKIIIIGLSIIVFFLTLPYSIKNINAYYSFGKFHLYIIIFGLYCFISSIWAYNAKDAIEKGITIFSILASVSIFYWYYKNQNRLITLLKLIMWAGYIVTLYTYWVTGLREIFNILNSAQRLSSTFDNINSIGILTAITIIITVYIILYEKYSKKLIILIIPTFILMIATGTRKAILILIIGIILLIIFKYLNRKIKPFVVFKIIIIFIILYIIIFQLFSIQLFSGIRLRLQGLISLFKDYRYIDHSTWLRQQYLVLGIKIFRENPILGVGIANPHYLNIYNDTYLHNNYIELLAGGGIFGFAIFYIIYLYNLITIVVSKAYKKNNETKIVLILLILILITEFGSVTYYSKITYIYFMIFFLNSAAIKRKKIRDFRSKKENLHVRAHKLERPAF